MEIGTYQILRAKKELPFGIYLEDYDGEEVLLPRKYVPENLAIGDELEVFVYKDHEHRPVATTLKPLIQVNQFAYLQVKMVSRFGAFMDWGLEKDLLVPFGEQTIRMVQEKYYMIHLYLDDKTRRLVGSAKVENFLDNKALTVEEGEEVDIIAWDQIEPGVQVIVNHKHKGLVYFNEMFVNLKPGEQRKGFVYKIREQNKLDIRLQRSGRQLRDDSSHVLLNKLRESGGFLPLTDKSHPTEISYKLEMSKKTFKKAVGALYKQRIIELEDKGIRLIKDVEETQD